MKQLKIGNITLENSIILAPMAGITDLPFRLLCKEHGVGLICMEMISAKAVLYNNKNTEQLLRIEEKECPVSMQLFGSEPEIVSQIAARLEDRPFSFLDINMGCPVPKVVNNGEGSALMKNPKLAAEIVRQTVKSISKPVTVKIRKGFDDNSINAVEIAKYLEDAGASAIAVHGRTRTQYYSGNADWDIIRKVKEAVTIPVIGNGDIVDGPSAKEIMDCTGCDGIMIGRACRGNPWIFSQIKAYLEDGKVIQKPSLKELKSMIMRHAQLMVDIKGQYTGMHEMRKHVAWYTAGYPHSAQVRRLTNEIESIEDLAHLLEKLDSEHSFNI